MDASGPFLLPRVRECFDFHSTIMDCNDTLCTPRPQQQAAHAAPAAAGVGDRAVGGRSRGSSRCQQGLVDTTHLYCPMDSPWEEEELHSAQRHGESKQHNHHGDHLDSNHVHGIQKQSRANGSQREDGCFTLGLPGEGYGGSGAREAEVERFDKTLHRPYVISTERFVFLRTILNVVALDGRLRFIRPWSHAHWVHSLTGLGFTAATFLPLVGEQVHGSCKGFPDCLGVRVSSDALSLTVCGRDVVSVSLWTNQQ